MFENLFKFIWLVGAEILMMIVMFEWTGRYALSIGVTCFATGLLGVLYYIGKRKGEKK